MIPLLRSQRQSIGLMMTLLLYAWQVAQPLHAATFLWTDAAGNTSVGANWSGGISPNAVSVSGDIFNFNNALTTGRTVTLDGLLTGGTLNIGDTTTTNAFTLAAGTGGYLTLDATSGNATITKTGNGADSISTGLQFNDTLAVTNSTVSGTLTLSGALRSLSSDITFNGTGAVAAGSTIVSGVISTSGSLTKNDAGITLLSGANTYAGTTTINGGTLQINNAAALPARSAVTVAAGATLDYLNTATTIGSLSGGGTVTASTASAARILTIGRDDTSTTFNGQFFGPAGQKARLAITKIGAGTLTLAPLSGSSATAAGDFTGPIVINGGALGLDFSQGSFTGTSMLPNTGGTSNATTIAGGNVIVKGRSGASIAQTLGNLTIGTGGGSVVINNNGGTATRLNFGTITSTAAGGSLLVNSPAGADVRFNQALNTATTINGRVVFTDGAGNFNWAANTGVNTTTVGLATYTDVAGGAPTGTDTNNSRIASATASQITTLGGAWTTNSLRINAGATGQSLALGANNLTLTNGGLLFTGANDYTISSTTGTLASATATNSDLVIHNYGTGNLTIGAIIANGVGTSTLTTAGTGRVTLTGANTFTGAIIVGGTSTLSFNNVASGASGGLGTGVRTAVTIRDGATLQYTGPTGTIGAANSTAGTHIYTLQGGNANIEVTDSAANLTLNGIISGAGGLTKIGPGTLTLASQDGAGTAGNSTYTGPTIISAGILSIGGSDRIPDASPLVIANSGATLNISNGSDTIGSLSGVSGAIVTAGTTTSARTLTVGGDNTSTTYAGAFQGSAASHAFVKTGTGVMTIQLSAATAWNGNSSITAGTLRLNNANGLPSTGAWTMGNSAQPALLDLNGFNASVAGLSFYGTASAISSEGTVSLGGATVTLTGNSAVNNNNNPRAALITGGTLTMTAARTFDVRDSATVLANDAELLITSNWSGAAGGITKVGGGNLKITGTNTMTGATANTFNSGITWLDYTTNNTDKINDTGALAFGGGTVILTGNNSAATAQTVAGLTLSSGSSVLTLNAGSGQTLALNLGGAITRATGGGGIRFNLPTGTQSGSNGVLTSKANVNGILGGYATATDGSGTGFATNSGGNIVVLASTAKDDVTTWSGGDNLTDSSGYTGTLGSSISVNSLRFNAAGPSTVTIGTGNTLEVASGGILQTSSVSGGTSLITGGTLTSGTGNELMFTVDSVSQRLEVASALNGATALTKLGNGIIRLSGANTSIGTVNLYSGTLQVSGGNAFGDAAALVISANKSSIFEVLTSESVGSLSGGQNQANLASEIRIASGAALTINQGVNGTYSGSITGSGTFIKSGTGTLVIDVASTTSLVSANSFIGGVTIDRGILEFNGAAGSLSGAASWTINGGGALYSNKNSTTTADAIGNTVGITLNNTNQGGAVFNTEGLVHRTNQGNTRAETIASLTLGAGHNTVTAFGNATSAIADLIIGTSAGVSRTDRATALVRGNALGASSGTRSQIRVSDATGNTALDTAEVGGGGAAASTNISIIPWLVGHLSETGLGNSFVTNTVTANGLRPLASTEYVNDNLTITGALTDNVRFTTGGTITGAPTTINSIVLDGATGLTLNGPASSMEITSGTLLSAQAVANVIDTFTGFTTGGGRDYTIYVTDPAGSLTLNSPLASGVPLVKSGAGTLILGSASNAFTDLYFNQGVVRADAAGKLGGAGALNFFGGSLRFDGAFDPTTSKTITIGTGGGTFDTNGNNISLAGSLGSGTGGFTKIGAGSLTLGAGATFSGGSTIQQGRLIVANGAGSATGTGLLTINGGPTTQASLGGTGIITGGVLLATNGATSFAQGPSINPGAVNGAGTLTINTTALTTNDFSSLTFDLTAATTAGGGVNDLISTDILPVFAGSTQININALSSLTAGGTYTLISGYSGTLPTFSNLSLNSTFTGETKSGVLLNNSGQLVLLVTGATPTTAYWAGDRDAFWNSIDTGSAATNWRTDISGNVNTYALPGAATDVRFYTTTPVAGNLATTLGASFTIKSLTFDATATNAVSISGGSLTINSSGGLSAASGAGAVTINSDMALGAAQTWTNNSTNAVTVNGEVSGAFSLTKAGTGTITLNGINTYSGGTILSAGTLVAGSSQALGLAANTLSLGGGILDLASNTSTTAKNTTVTGNVTINSNLASSGAGITHTLGTLTIGAQTLSITKGANVTSGTAGVAFGATDIGLGGAVFDAATGTVLTITGILSGGPANSDQSTPAANTAMTIKGGAR